MPYFWKYMNTSWDFFLRLQKSGLSNLGWNQSLFQIFDTVNLFDVFIITFNTHEADEFMLHRYLRFNDITELKPGVFGGLNSLQML